MAMFGLGAAQVLARMDRNERREAVPSIGRSIGIGGIGFCLASLCVFATVAFAERAMYQNLGLSGAYIVWTVLFILLGGSALSPIVVGPGRWWRFQLLFCLAFLLYAIGWIGFYFALGGLSGEWAGSLAGSVLMALMIALAFGVMKNFLHLSIVLFVANSAGYFLGEWLFFAIAGKAGMVLWGVLYGLFLGAGLGLSLYLAQAPLRDRFV